MGIFDQLLIDKYAQHLPGTRAPLSEETIPGTGRIDIGCKGQDENYLPRHSAPGGISDKEDVDFDEDDKEGSGNSYDPLRVIVEAQSDTIVVGDRIEVIRGFAQGKKGVVTGTMNSPVDPSARAVLVDHDDGTSDVHDVGFVKKINDKRAFRLSPKQQAFNRKMKRMIGQPLHPLDGATPTVGNLLQSRIHESFTRAADDLCSLGYMDTELRIKVSQAIGQALSVLNEFLVDSNLMDMPIDEAIAKQIVFKTAQYLVDDQYAVREVGNNQWEVTKFYEMDLSVPENAYTITFSPPFTWQCSCPAWYRTRQPCKHVQMVKDYQSWGGTKKVVESLVEDLEFLVAKRAQSTESDPYTTFDRQSPQRRPEDNRFLDRDIPQVVLEDDQADPGYWEQQLGWDVTTDEEDVALIRPGSKSE